MLEHTHYIAKMNAYREHKMWQDHGTREYSQKCRRLIAIDKTIMSDPHLPDFVKSVAAAIAKAISYAPLFALSRSRNAKEGSKPANKN